MDSGATSHEVSTLTVKQAAQVTGLETWRLYRLFRDGAIPGYRVIRSIRVLGEFAADLAAEMRSGHAVDVAEFCRQWMADTQSPAAEAVSA
jgi:excisionase family DNA binding protein